MAATTHRPVKLGSKGPDVSRLVHFANVRVSRVNEPDRCAPETATLGRAQAATVDYALWVLGFQGLTIWRGKPEHGGHFSVSAQRAVINPSLRTADQVQRAGQRRALIAKRHDHKAKATTGGPSGLTQPQRRRARQLAVQAARLGLAHAPVVHYTQGAARWQGIADHRVAAHGAYPNYADCSAFVTWCLWNGLYLPYGVGDVVNGADWRAGYTGTMLSHGIPVGLDRLVAGDAILYGRGFPGEHTAIYVGGGKVISHGSEAGPFLLPVKYRGDVMQARRYI